MINYSNLLMAHSDTKRHRTKVRLTVLTSEQTVNAIRKPVTMTKKPEAEVKPGDGIRSLQTSKLFKTLNFELYMKPNAVIMGLGLACMGGALLYLAYMRRKYESLGYYSAVTTEGNETFLKKKSKWD